MPSADRAGLQQPRAGRIEAFDWLRGLAVVVMVQTHAVVLLQPPLRQGRAYLWLDSLDGLVAPAFLFSAGFALGLVVMRAALAGQLQVRLRASVRRALEVLAVACLVNLIWYPLREPQWLLRLDILHVIGLSLLAVLGVLALTARRPGVAAPVLLLLALGVFVVAPLLEGVEGPARLFLSHRPGVLSSTAGATFALLPWAGYTFLGASFGVVVARLRREVELWRWWAVIVGLGLLAWAATPWLRHAYPAHDFYKTNPADAGRRWAVLLLGFAGLRGLERWRTPAPRALRWLAAVGVASLPAYFFHEMLLFEWHVGVFGLLFRERAGWALYWVLVVALLGATWLCVRLFERARAWLTSWRAAPLRSSA